MRTQKPKTELIECAATLLKLDLLASIEVMEYWIEESYQHLISMKSVRNCNESMVFSLAQRIRRVEFLLEQKKKQAEEKRRDVR